MLSYLEFFGLGNWPHISSDYVAENIGALKLMTPLFYGFS